MPERTQESTTGGFAGWEKHFSERCCSANGEFPAICRSQEQGGRSRAGDGADRRRVALGVSKLSEAATATARRRTTATCIGLRLLLPPRSRNQRRTCSRLVL